MIDTLITISGFILIIGGVFGLGVWFVRTYDSYKERKIKEKDIL